MCCILQTYDQLYKGGAQAIESEQSVTRLAILSEGTN